MDTDCVTPPHAVFYWLNNPLVLIEAYQVLLCHEASLNFNLVIAETQSAHFGNSSSTTLHCLSCVSQQSLLNHIHLSTRLSPLFHFTPSSTVSHLHDVDDILHYIALSSYLNLILVQRLEQCLPSLYNYDAISLSRAAEGSKN
jgi:hypothetical protein